MEKIWYIYLDGAEEGPYSKLELRRDTRLTPNTLAWRDGFDTWLPIRNIPDLRDLFEKEEEPETVEESEEEGKEVKGVPREEIALEYNKDPSFYFFILLVAIILILYIIYEFYWSK